MDLATSGGDIRTIKTTSDYTRQICYCSFFSMLLIIIFIVSPLGEFVMVSSIMKVCILLILGYTIYLNSVQISMLQNTNKTQTDAEVSAQLSSNIMCSYVFTAFLCLLFIFVVKSFF
jgi:glucan phosphoethanolaminetransferase (alkaline phosphatase superfamily)